METVLMACLFIAVVISYARKETQMRERMFERGREYLAGKYDHERDWEKYPPLKWVLEMYMSNKDH